MRKNDLVWFILMVFAMVFWGSGWAVGKLATTQASAEVLGFYRYLFTALSFSFIFIFYKKRFYLNKKIVVLLLIGSVATTLFNIFFFKALEDGDSGAGGALVTTLAPIITFLYTLFIVKAQVTFLQKLAIAIGAFGGFLMLGLWDLQTSFIFQTSNIYFFFAALSWAAATVTASYAKDSVDPFYYTFFVFVIVTFLSYLFAAGQNPFDIADFGFYFWFGTLFLGVLAGGFATGIFFIASSKLGASKAGVFMFMVPVSSMVTSYFVFSEIPKISFLIGAILSIFAITIYHFSSPKQKSV